MFYYGPYCSCIPVQACLPCVIVVPSGTVFIRTYRMSLSGCKYQDHHIIFHQLSFHSIIIISLPFKLLTWFCTCIFLQVHACDFSYTPSWRSWNWLFQRTQDRCIKLFKFFGFWLDFIFWELVWRWKLWDVSFCLCLWTINISVT